MKPKHVIFRSKGCRTCRARKVKCDETRPVCQRCTRSRMHCKGYAEATVFLQENPLGRTKTPRTSSNATPEASSLPAVPGTLLYPTETRLRRAECDEGELGCTRCQFSGSFRPGCRTDRVKSVPTCISVSACTLSPKVGWENTRFQDIQPPTDFKDAPFEGFFWHVDCVQAAANQNYSHVCCVNAVSFSQIPLLINPTSSRFDDEQECRYFQSFRQEVLPRLQGAFVDSSLWTEIITEGVQKELSLRCALIAVAALNKALDMLQEIPLPPVVAQGPIEHYFHYRIALRYYQKAIYCLKGIKSAKIALVACLLFFSFESLSGRPDLAISTLKSGFNLLNNLQSKSEGSKTPLMSHVETKLIRTFGNLGIQVMPYAGIQDMSFFRALGRDDSTDEIPPVFSDVTFARQTLEQIMVRSLQSYVASNCWGNTAVSSDTAVLDYTTGAFKSKDGTESTRAALMASVTAHLRWSLAFEPLLSNLCNTASQEDFMNAITLQLHSKTTGILLARSVFTSESAFDKFLPDFQEIVRLCTLQIARSVFSKPALFVGYGINLPLFMTATKCRHRVTRRQAILLLLRTRRNEGIWDGGLASTIATWVAGLEEERDEAGDAAEINSTMDGFIPEERRVKISRINLDYNLRAATIECTSCRVAKDGTQIHVETSFTWN